MPFHLRSLSISKNDEGSKEKKDRRKSQNLSEDQEREKSAFIPTPPIGSDADKRRKSLQLERTISISNDPTPSTRPKVAHHGSSSSTTTRDGGLQSILKPSRTGSGSTNSEYTNSVTSGNGSAFLGGIHKRMSSLAFDRTNTIESMSNYDDELDLDRVQSNSERNSIASPTSTPGTSVSSFGGNIHCPLPGSTSSSNSTSGSIDENAFGKFPIFMMSISSVSTLSFIALPIHLRTTVIDVVNQVWKKGISKIGEVDYQPELKKKHKEKGCDSGVWEITLKGEAWMPSSSEQVSSKRIMIKLLTEFAREGYSLTSSFRTSAKDSGKDSLIFLRDEPDPEPVFFAVAFYSHDRIWIIDAEADVGQALEEGIKNWWVDGLRDARVRERHCRELRLRGAPWTAHSTQSLISARCIHLTIMKLVTHCDTGYDFIGSVDMADKEEGEMPVTFYRKKWDDGRGHSRWKMSDGEGNGLGLSSVMSP